MKVRTVLGTRPETVRPSLVIKNLDQHREQRMPNSCPFRQQRRLRAERMMPATTQGIGTFGMLKSDEASQSLPACEEERLAK